MGWQIGVSKEGVGKERTQKGGAIRGERDAAVSPWARGVKAAV